MSVNAVTHLNFRGDARHALEFYHSVFGGELTITSYEDMGNVQEDVRQSQSHLRLKVDDDQHIVDSLGLL